MHFIMIKFVLICLYLMMPLRTKVILFCIFLKQYNAAIEIYWHNNPTYLSLMGTSLFKKIYCLLAKILKPCMERLGFFIRTDKIRNTVKDQVYMKNFIYFATMWHYREMSGNVNYNFILFILLFPWIEILEIFIWVFQIFLWSYGENKNIENKLFY